jgi:CheY-like chemotaxis protein
MKPRSDLPTLSGRVLTVDDRPEIRFLVREFVEAAGGEVDLAENGEQAVQAWMASRNEQQAIDAILMDVQKPLMDGLEASRRLRAEGYRGPILALTANVMRRDRERCLEAGCSDFISKPIDQYELLQKLARWIDRSRQEASASAAAQRNVLCVDDHPAIREAHRILLEHYGHRVETAATGDEALRLVDRFIPDVILLDLGLEGMTGDELLAQMKAIPALNHCRFVCLSARQEGEVAWQEMGFDQYVRKPADADELNQVVLQTKPQRGPASP